MFGNDVIDLCYAKNESNWKREGYLNKIYTSSEQLLINSAKDSNLMVWILWSMKEASYKANHRITSIREYAPLKINCEIIKSANNFYYGTVTYNSLKYYTKTFISKKYIHTIAAHNSNDFSGFKVILVKNYPLNYEDYLITNGFLDCKEKIMKDEFGIPNLYNASNKLLKPISISHHGEFFSLIITNSRINLWPIFQKKNY